MGGMWDASGQVGVWTTTSVQFAVAHRWAPGRDVLLQACRRRRPLPPRQSSSPMLPELPLHKGIGRVSQRRERKHKIDTYGTYPGYGTSAATARAPDHVLQPKRITNQRTKQ